MGIDGDKKTPMTDAIIRHTESDLGPIYQELCRLEQLISECCHRIAELKWNEIKPGRSDRERYVARVEKARLSYELSVLELHRYDVLEQMDQME